MILTRAEIEEKIRPICEKYGVKKLFLFGSYARGDATEKSDVDFRLISGRDLDLFKMIGLRMDLEEALGKEVDLISQISKDSEIFKKYYERDAMLLYEAKRKRRTNSPEHSYVLQGN
ncbi:nucleotidyltransferase domain-containing protein [Selenomonas sputigena]|uniref:Nucleotidyltransferase domain-containing protein n=1 Tax=Selenomonas sputigena TaxID=69823 RepID=A0ABV3X735_9FIRM